MPLQSIIVDIYSSLTFSPVQAETRAPEPKDAAEETVIGNKPGEPAAEAETKEEPSGEAAADAGDKEETEPESKGEKEGGAGEEEEEEEEPVDPLPALEAECTETTECKPYKHHYEECAERVMAAEADPDPDPKNKEDCVEEFFHLVHCTRQCSAPKLFAKLK